MSSMRCFLLLVACVNMTSCAHLASISQTGSSSSADIASHNSPDLDPNFASFDPDAVAVPALPAASPAFAPSFSPSFSKEDSSRKQDIAINSKLEESERKLEETERELLDTRQKLSEAEKKLAEFDAKVAAAVQNTVVASKSIESLKVSKEVSLPSNQTGAKTRESVTEVKPIGFGKTQMYVNGQQINIRINPNRFSKSIGMVYGGQPVMVTMNGDWAKLEDGKWLRTRWLSVKKPSKFKQVKPVELNRSLSSN